MSAPVDDIATQALEQGIDVEQGPVFRKRKRTSSTTRPEVLDLSDIKTEDEARQDRSFISSSRLGQPQAVQSASENQVIEVCSDEEQASVTQSQQDRRRVPTIDLDDISSTPQTIDIDSEDEDDRLLTNLDEFSLHEYVGSFSTRAVGIRFYRGRVTTTESVFLRREPQNAYDRNAIQVRNVNGQQVGHLPAPIAAGLAPWLDNKVCLVEASVKSKALVYSIPLTVDVFAHGAVAAEVPNALARAGIQLNDDKTRRTRKGQAGNVIDLTEIQEASTVVNVRQATALLDELTVNVKDLQSMKKAIQPARLSTKLLDYQLQGLHWMVEKESPHLPVGSQTVQMWQKLKDSSSYFNVATNFKTDTEPVLGLGGLLSDDMGLGKTLQVLSLIVAGQESTPDLIPIKQPTKVPYSDATLVLCPTSLMTNWVDQSVEHVGSSQSLRVERYHGKNRSTKKQLEQNELVVSTYGTLTSEWKKLTSGKSKKKRPTQGLFSVRWKRIILDEAHKIRNAKSQASLAVHALEGERRWCLTGTPVVNSYNDLGALIRFVRWTGGIESPELFNAKITRKLLSSGEDVQKESVKLIKILMQDLSLRRRKDLEFGGKKLIELPKITEYHHKMEFETKEEAETYEKLAKQAKGILRAGTQQSRVLEILLRMRQACCAKGLISEERLALLERLNELDTVEFTEGNKLLLQNFLALAVEASEDCPICLEPLIDQLKTPVITYCKHVFCRDCICASIASKESCPLCRASLKESQLLSMPAKDEAQRDDNVLFEENSSTKINGLMRILEATHRQDATNKTVVFSQWTKLLDMVEVHLREKAVNFCRIDGTMTLSARDESVRRLQTGTASVMLASLAVASVGLNLTAANAVILMDPWWSPAIEDQAIDRVYRLGQKRQVTVYKMVIEDSVEEKVLEIQERKRKMTATIGAGQSRSQQTQTRRADIEALLGG